MIINATDALHKLLAAANSQRGKAIIAEFASTIVTDTPPAFVIAFVGEDAPRVQRMIADKLKEAGCYDAPRERVLFIPGEQ